MMRRAAKVDANHRAVVNLFRAYGCSVQSLAAVGDGVPDLLVGRFGRSHLVEVKDGSKPPSQRKLTKAQVAWRDAWKGSTIHVVTNLGDVSALSIAWAQGRETPDDGVDSVLDLENLKHDKVTR